MWYISLLFCQAIIWEKCGKTDKLSPSEKTPR